MAMVTYPLNNVQYNAEDAELYNAVRTSGVWSGASFDAEVTGNDTIVTIGEGLAWIANTKFSGKVVAQKEAKGLDLGAADPSYNRIDVIAIQFDSVENRTDLIVKKGVASSNPEIPARSTTESLYELYLYSILRTAGSSVVSKSNITDLRDNREYCGYMQDSIKPGYAPSLMEHNNGADFRFWVGTKAEYEAKKEIIPPNTFCVITDDTTEADLRREIDGKAPAGFGLGGECQRVADWNLALQSGFFQGSKNSPNGASFYGYVIKHTDKYLVQHAYAINEANKNENHAIRTMSEGVFGEWEWVNPQCLIDHEYRTVERWNGSPVYTKLFNFGVVPNYNNTKQVAHGIAKVDYITKIHAVLEDGMAFPPELSVWAGKDHVKITSKTSETDYLTAYVQLWYTKL